MSLPYGLSPLSAFTPSHTQSQLHNRPTTAASYSCSTRSSSPVSIRSIQSINSILSQRRSRILQRRRSHSGNLARSPLVTPTSSSLLGRIYGDDEGRPGEEEDEAREVLGIMEPAPRETMMIVGGGGGSGLGGIWAIGEILEEGARIAS